MANFLLSTIPTILDISSRANARSTNRTNRRKNTKSRKLGRIKNEEAMTPPRLFPMPNPPLNPRSSSIPFLRMVARLSDRTVRQTHHHRRLLCLQRIILPQWELDNGVSPRNVSLPVVVKSTSVETCQGKRKRRKKSCRRLSQPTSKTVIIIFFYFCLLYVPLPS